MNVTFFLLDNFENLPHWLTLGLAGPGSRYRVATHRFLYLFHGASLANPASLRDISHWLTLGLAGPGSRYRVATHRFLCSEICFTAHRCKPKFPTIKLMIYFPK